MATIKSHKQLKHLHFSGFKIEKHNQQADAVWESQNVRSLKVMQKQSGGNFPTEQLVFGG
jgi:hypothetical protein